MLGAEALLYVGICQTLFITTVLIFTPHKNTTTHIIVIWIICLSLPLFSQIVQPDIFNIPLPLLNDQLPYGFLYGPLLLLYIDQLTATKVWHIRGYIIHAIPFIMVSFDKLVSLTGAKDGAVLIIAATPLSDRPAIAIMISSISYSLIALRRLARHKQEVLQHFSSLPNKITLNWLIWLSILFLITSSLPILSIPFNLPELLNTRVFALVGFIFILSYFSLQQTQVFQAVSFNNGPIEKVTYPNIKSPPLIMPHQHHKSMTEPSLEKKNSPAANDPEDQKDKYERSGLTKERSQSYLQQLNQYMLIEKPYLDANLTLDKLAQRAQIPRHYLTQVISEQLNKNFYQFVNEHRIKSVEQQLIDPAHANMTLLALAHASGFNSKSTFNTVFKKINGMTPSQYRKSNNPFKQS